MKNEKYCKLNLLFLIYFSKLDYHNLDISTPFDEVDGQGLGVVSSKFNGPATSKFSYITNNNL